MKEHNCSYSTRIGKTTFIVNVKQSETAQKPLNTVFQEICKHEVLEDCSADKSSILENHKKSSWQSQSRRRSAQIKLKICCERYLQRRASQHKKLWWSKIDFGQRNGGRYDGKQKRISGERLFVCGTEFTGMQRTLYRYRPQRRAAALWGKNKGKWL